MSARSALPAAALLLLAGAADPAPTQNASRRPPTFPAGVELIRLSISVTDAANRYVRGLSADTFAVFEDGVRQDAAYFTNDPVPLSVAVLLDGSASMEESLPTVQAAAVRFVRTLGPDDLAQVVGFNDRMSVLQDFTSDQSQLEAAIRRSGASGSTALYTALYVALKQLASHGTPEAPRRRAIVVLSDGEDTSSPMDDDQVLEEARQAGVSVYAIALSRDKPQRRERDAAIKAKYFLTSIARETGGQVFTANSVSELGAAYDLVAEELRTQYTLAYVSSNPLRDGSWRRIVIRTPGRQDLRVRYRTSYRAPAK